MDTRRPVSWLVAGRLAGLAGAIGIPMVLARILDPADLGAYRQVFLIYATLYAIAQVGMAESLYYFLPRAGAGAAREDHGRYAANAAAALAAAGILCTVVLVVAAGPIARLLGDAPLARWLPALGLFVPCMLVSAVLEIVLTCGQRYRAAGTAYFISDVARAAIMIVPALIWRSLDAVIAGAVIFAVGRLLATGAVLARVYPAALRPNRRLLREQLGYALPFAAVIVVDTLQAQLHLYVVSAREGAAIFAVYSIACFQVPVADFMATSVSNVLMVGLAGTRGGPEALAQWRAAVARLALVLLPLVAWLVASGRDVIVFLFSARYAASGPLFVLASLSMAFVILPTDAVLRATADTKLILRIGLVRLALVAVLLPLALPAFGLAGAILSTLASTAVAKGLALRYVRRRLGATWRDLLPGRELVRGAAASTAGALASLAALRLAPALPLFWRLALSGSVFAVVAFGLSARFGLLAAARADIHPVRVKEGTPCAASPAS